MVRRSFWSLFFAVLFVFAQREAMLHPYEHTLDWQQKSLGNKQVPLHSQVCEKCLALADVNGILGSKSQALDVLPGYLELPSTIRLSFVSLHFSPYRSRAPPNLAQLPS